MANARSVPQNAPDLIHTNMTSTARRADATSPALSLSLRVALLESLVVGRSQLGNGVSAASEANISSTSRSILSRTLQAQEKLDEALKPHRPVSQFAADYGHNRPYLIPSFATLGGGTSLTSSQDAGKGEGEEQALPRGTTMTPQTQVALLLEAEQDLRDLERDLRQCQTLDERGVAGAGKLAGENCVVPSFALCHSDLSLLLF